MTPTGGGGASLALVGGYVLAAQLAEDSTSEDVEASLEAYERWMRPSVSDVQDLPRWIGRSASPQTRCGLARGTG